MKRLLPALLVPFLLAFATPVVVRWSAVRDTVRVASRAPSSANVVVRAAIIPGWHVYSLTQKAGGPKPLSIALERASGFSAGIVTGPKPQTAYDAQFKLRTETYSGSADFTVPIKWTTPLPAGTTEIRLIIRYMACSAELCLPPRKEALTVEIKPPGAR